MKLKYLKKQQKNQPKIPEFYTSENIFHNEIEKWDFWNDGVRNSTDSPAKQFN